MERSERATLECGDLSPLF